MTVGCNPRHDSILCKIGFHCMIQCAINGNLSCVSPNCKKHGMATAQLPFLMIHGLQVSFDATHVHQEISVSSKCSTYRLFPPRPAALASLPGRFFVPPPFTPSLPLPPGFRLSLNIAFISALDSAVFCLPSFFRPPNPYLASLMALFLLFPGKSATSSLHCFSVTAGSRSTYPTGSTAAGLHFYMATPKSIH